MQGLAGCLNAGQFLEPCNRIHHHYTYTTIQHIFSRNQFLHLPEKMANTKCPSCDANADVTKDGKMAHCASCTSSTSALYMILPDP